MPKLQQALATLRAHQDELRAMGVRHAAVFGSVARGESTAASDLDILVDLDPEKRLDLFDYAGIKLYLAEIFGLPEESDRLDMAHRGALKPRPRRPILEEAVEAF